MKACDVIKNSGISFGTSGARGLVEDFTEQVCAAFTQSFLVAMKEQQFEFSSVAVAIDNRPSSSNMAAAVCAAVESFGCKAVYYGVLPTPALAYQAMQDKQPSIMITGSHIPFDRNGIKFYRPDGEITKLDEAAILNSEVEVNVSSWLLPEVSQKAFDGYMGRYIDYFGRQALAGLKIGIYEHSSAGRDLYAHLFEKLGATVVSLGRSDVFVPIDTEAVAEEDRARARVWSKEYGFDAIFSTDGDGDRPLIADEKGEWLRGDIAGLLTASLLGVEALAVPVSCNTAIELSEFFKCVVRTRIGSPYVIDAFDELVQKYRSVAGFEANGGFLLATHCESQGKLLKPLPTRDALLPAMVLFSQVVVSKSPLSLLVENLPKRFTASDRIQNIPTDISRKMIDEGLQNMSALLIKLGVNRKVAQVNQVDGLRIVLEGGDIIHLRPSGNAPELRCYTESSSQLVANELVTNTLERIKSII